MSTEVRKSKLSFKGDKPQKRKKRAHRELEGKDDEEGDPQDWVLPTNPDQILGPTFIMIATDPPSCLAYDATRSRVALPHLPPAETGQPLDITPTEVSHVWVTTRVAGAGTLNLRTPDGKFLSSDVHGLVSADSEARGPQEEWTAEILEGGMVAFKNMYDKYLGIDEVAGGAMRARGDAESVGFAESWRVKVQREYKRKAGEEERKRAQVEGKRKIDEVETNAQFQTWGMGRSVVSTADKRELKRARKEGELSEAMLDRRAKLKSDRFC